MKELLFMLPILASIALVLGGCRGETVDRIFLEAGKSFGRILGAIVVIVLILQVFLWVIPRVF